MTFMLKGGITQNLIANVASFGVGTLISFILTPYLVNSLGTVAYGFFPLALSIFNYTTIITYALNSMAGRFIAVEEHKGNTSSALRYFNTVFFSNLIVSIVLMIIGFVFINELESFIQIPNYLVSDVKLLFLLVILGSVLTLAFSVYSSATFVKNRIDIQALTTIISKIVQTVSIVVLFILFEPNIVYLGISFLGLALTQSVLRVIYKRKLLPNFRLDIHTFSLGIVCTLLKAGVWRSLSQMSAIFLVGLDLVIANLFLGPVAAGILAIAKTIPSLIYTFSGTIAVAFVPHLVRVYAQDSLRLASELKTSSKVLTLFAPIVLGGFISLGYDFYQLWLPAQNASLLYILSVLTALPIAVSCGVVTQEYVFLITNKLAVDALLMLIMSIANVIVVLVLLKTTSLGLYAIAGVSATLEIGRRVVFWPILSAKYCGREWYTFYPDYFKSWLCTLAVIGVGGIVRTLIPIDSWITLTSAALVTAAAVLPINIALTINRCTRQKILMYAKERLAVGEGQSRCH